MWKEFKRISNRRQIIRGQALCRYSFVKFYTGSWYEKCKPMEGCELLIKPFIGLGSYTRFGKVFPRVLTYTPETRNFAIHTFPRAGYAFELCVMYSHLVKNKDISFE